MTPSQAIVILLLATALPRSSPAQERAADRTLAITNVPVLPMDRDRTLPGYTVIIAGGSQTRPYARITHMGPADRIALPAGAERIDGTGKYLMPGWWIPTCTWPTSREMTSSRTSSSSSPTA
jgi:hypothetical protein